MGPVLIPDRGFIQDPGKQYFIFFTTTCPAYLQQLEHAIIFLH